MFHCPRCGAGIAAASRFCSACGAELSSASELPTEAVSPTAPRHPASLAGRGDPSDSVSSTRFAPGHMLAGRYRIVGLLGRGGMGEVYRADDLTLDQPVALKFLPESMAAEPGLLARFRAEVRNARQVAHPNVCRVYDIGEAEGHAFITMEYVDGEDLATLLRRIGHLSAAKASEVARQICAGLAAAHDRGLLHRDLKPSNVMLDGDGRVRITDFGLAVRHGEGEGETSGTPAYMAPEQFEGRAATPQTDLYALGLILFEVFTGGRAFSASSRAEWQQRHTESAPPSATESGEPVPEAVDRVIRRCLEKDPSRRPASALQVAAALPGGDPLAAALAAGEMPSPEMVAASGGEGALSVRAGLALLLPALVLMAAVIVLGRWSSDLGLAEMTRGPEVLAQRARDLAARFGYADNVLDTERWIARDYDALRHRAQNVPSVEWRAGMGAWGPPLLLRYRQSPVWLEPNHPDGRVGQENPPFSTYEMVSISLDGRGRLVEFRAVPPRVDSVETTTEPDWSAMMAEAELDPAAFREIRPVHVPTTAFDARREWVGPASWDPAVEVHVSAASFDGRPVAFEVRPPWKIRDSGAPRARSTSAGIATTTLTLVNLALLGMMVYLAIRNLRLGRGDRAGALRLGLLMGSLGAVAWLALAHHMPSLQEEFNLFGAALSAWVTVGLFFALTYLAVEPYVRRRLPALLVGWARALEGRFTDPHVGRDVLIGALAGCAMALVTHASNALPSWIPIRGQTTIPPPGDLLIGGSHAVGALASLVAGGLAIGLVMFGMMFLLRLLLRGAVATFIALAAIVALINLGGENVLVETPGAVLAGVIVAAVAMRLGLLPLVAMMGFATALSRMPLPLAAGAPYLGTSIAMITLLGVILAAAFRVSIGRRRLFALED